ncbi:MAG: ATP-binding protein [Lachnospiraceae bacterium]|nr:ATP-binding protein [Lachnospiraceae bacterium]
MIERKIQTEIRQWLDRGKKALLVTGARQIGKTYLIRSVLEDSGCDYMEFNFIENPELIPAFENARNTEELLFRLGAVTSRPLPEKDAVIFVDEVQECKEFVTRIKFLVEDGRYRYVLSGSLLGIELADLRSAPVGYMDILDMYPVDLEEFFAALGLSEEVFAYVRECFWRRRAVSEEIHARLMDAFYLYLLVGGMPEAVQSYLDTNRMNAVTAIHRQIVRLYYADFSKYEKSEKLRLREIYDAIPSELQEKNKRFYINHIAGKAEYEDVKNDFLWLKNAGVAIPVYNVTEPKIPLKISEKRNLFKLFLSDVGLLTSQYEPNVRISVLNKSAGINNGGLFENVVAQEFLTRQKTIYYYNNKKSGEVDFVTELDGQVLPIEVKSGKDYKRHSALTNLLYHQNYGIPEAFVLCDDNLRQKEKVTYLPIYMLFCIKDTQLENDSYPMDLSTVQL